MKLVVLGATGATGLCLVEQALKDGHSIVAPIRMQSMHKIEHLQQDKLTMKDCSIFDEDGLAKVMEGCDAVVSCLGVPITLWKVTLYSQSIKVITGAMRKSGINRLIAMSTACSRTKGELGIVHIILGFGIAGRMLSDMVRMEDFLKENCGDINWTVVKPPTMEGDPLDNRTPLALEGDYVPGGEFLISHPCVSKFILEQLSNDTWNQKLVSLAMPKQ